MKTSIHHFQDTRRAFHSTVLVLLCWSLAGTILPAATITWSGAGGDALWSNPTNWNGGALPTSEDDVVINVPGNATVQMDVYNTTVRSLQCQETFVVEGRFRLIAGASVINGSLRMNPSYWLEVNGPATVLTVNGAVTNVAGLDAQNGGVIALPSVRQLTVDAVSSSAYSSSWLSASGAGSAVVMTNLTNVIMAPYYYFQAAASDGGRIDLRRLKVPDGPFRVSVQGPNSLVDLSGFIGLWTLGPEYLGWWRNSLTAGDGGSVLIPNITAFENVDVSVTGMTNVALNQIRSFAGWLYLTSRTNGLGALTNFNGSLFAYDSRLDLTNFTVLHATNGSISFQAYQGSVINLSAVTNVITGHESYGIDAYAQEGSRIDLRGLRQPAPQLRVSASGAASVINLTGLHGEWTGAWNSSLQAQAGASVLIPNVTAMRLVTLDLRDDAIVPTSQIRSYADGGITLYGRTNGFEGLTNFTGAFYAYQNTRLDLTNFTVLYATNGYVPTFHAYQGSYIDLSRLTNVVSVLGYGLSAYADGGSRIDLSRLRVSPEGRVSVAVSGLDSLVDLSGLSGVWRDGVLAAYSGGTVLIPNVTALEAANLTVDGSANVNLAQIGSFTDGWLTLSSRTNDFLWLTNFAGTTIGVTDSHLILTNITTLYTTNNGLYISANNGSVIDLSRVTNWVSSGWQLYVYAYNNSRIDLSRLPTPEWPFRVDARDAGSVVDLSEFNGLWSGGGGVTALYGATVLISNVTAMENVALDLRGDANVATAQLRSFTTASINLEGRTNVFPELTNFTGSLGCTYARAEFPMLTQLDATDYSVTFSAGYDSVIDLSQVTSSVVNLYSVFLYAYGGGRIEVPRLETVVAGSVGVTADGAGSVVDLSGLTGFFSDNNGGSLTTRNGGAILLNNGAMLLAGVAIDSQSNPGDILPPFLAPSGSLVLYGRPWKSYRIESRNPAVSNSPWLLYQRVALTDTLLDLGPRPPSDLALRVYAFEANPPEVDIRRSGPGAVEAILFGVPGGNYQLESRLALEPSSNWTGGVTTTLTNSFAIFPIATATHDARFFRAVKP